jgi:outer membrane beta-barrel protein
MLRMAKMLNFYNKSFTLGTEMPSSEYHRQTRSRVLGIMIILATVWILAPLHVYANGNVPKKVVQNRKEVPTYEWTLATGLLPLDAFKKGITAGGSLTIHRNHLWAWEAISAAYSFEYKTALEDELRVFKLQATPFERVKAFVLSNLVFKPLYWKGSWLNNKMAYGELFFVAGGGYGWLTQTSRPVVDGGFGVKILHEGELASRLDVRMLTFFNAEDVHNELWVNLGFSL